MSIKSEPSIIELAHTVFQSTIAPNEHSGEILTNEFNRLRSSAPMHHYIRKMDDAKITLFNKVVAILDLNEELPF